MNKPTFTKGPWASEDCTPGESEGLCFAISSEDTVIARTTDGWNEARANARLIASAPEMHALLKVVLPILEDCAKERHRMHGETRLGEHRDKLREILAKVEGEK
jgi:hypothetical protein